MTEIQLYKFINDNGIEWAWDMNKRGENDVLAWVPFWELEDFAKLVGSSFFADGNIGCVLLDSCIVIYMEQICDHHGIDIEKVFEFPSLT